MEVALILISFLTFLFSSFLLLKKRMQRKEVFFYFLWLFLFISLTISSNYKNAFTESVANAFTLLFFVLMISLSPLLYNVVFDNLKKEEINIKNYYIPFILFLINTLSFLFLTFQKNEKAFTFKIVEEMSTYINYIIILFFFPIWAIYYSVKSHQLIGSFPTKKLLYKAPEKFYFSLFILFFDLFVLIWLIQNYLIADLTIKSILKSYYLVYFVISFFVLWKGKKYVFIKNNLEAESNQDLFTEINERLNLKLEVDKIFLQPNLDVKTLAKELETNEKYLSQLINKKYNVNFSNFINEHRIEYSKKVLLDPKYSNYTVEAIGNLSGFNSKSGFNATFKKHTGLTPTDYKKGA